MAYPAPMTTRVRELRKQRGWDQEELAHRAGVSQSSVSRIENGQQNATLGAIERVARALGVTVPELFDPPTTAEIAGLAARWAALSEPHRMVIEAALHAAELQQRKAGE